MDADRFGQDDLFVVPELKDFIMFRTLLTASAAAVALSSASFAGEGDFRLGVGYSNFDVDGFNFGAISVTGGADFSEYFGVEGQLDFGIADDSVTVGGTSVDVELNYAASVFGVARLPIDEGHSNLFFRAGYTWAEVEASAAGVAAAADGDGFAFGVGGEFFFDDVNAVRIDYTRHEIEDGEADVFGIRYIRRFGAR